jgi:excisionase family DNA binding protein
MHTKTLNGDAPAHPEQLLTLEQAASQLAVSKRTLYRMIASGEFPRPIRVGGSCRVSQIELVEFLDRAKKRRV